MTTTDRARRQSTADHAGRPARIEAVTRDLRADVEAAEHWPTLTSAPDSWGVQYDKETP